MKLDTLREQLKIMPESADFLQQYGFEALEADYHPPVGLTEQAIGEKLALLNLNLDAAPLLQAAKTLRQNEALSHFFNFVSYYWWHGKECDVYTQKLPQFSELLGEDMGGLVNLVLALDGVESIFQKFEALNLPKQYAQDALQRIPEAMKAYASFHQGKLGYTETQHHWMRHFINGRLFRVGRFEYMLEAAPLEHCAAMFRRKADGAWIGLCREGWKLRKDGLQLRRDETETPDVITAHLKITGREITGIPVNPIGFAETGRTLTLSRDEFEEAWSADDLVLDIHVPPGGGMTPERCRSSFLSAIDFFRQYFKREVKAFTGVSWIFNHDLVELLPQSNLAKFMTQCYLSPFPSGDEDGLRFVFGKSAADWSSFPRETSLQRAFHQLRESGKKLKMSAMCIEKRAIEAFGSNLYKQEYAANFKDRS